jgi:hypothetical protein
MAGSILAGMVAGCSKSTDPIGNYEPLVEDVGGVG